MHVQMGRCALASTESQELCGQSHKALGRKPATCQICLFSSFGKVGKNFLSLIKYIVVLYPFLSCLLFCFVCLFGVCFGCLLKAPEGIVGKTSPHLDCFSGRTLKRKMQSQHLEHIFIIKIQ